MKSNNQFKLINILILFTFIGSLTTTTFDYFRHKEQIIEMNENHIQQLEDNIIHSVRIFEKAYDVFDNKAAETMESITYELIDLYMTNPHFEDWDFQELKQEYNLDIYIIDKRNVIQYSSLQEDVGIDFKECCQTLSGILDERRKSGHFYVDGMDIEQSSGSIKKYSYMATPDKEYIIELGYELEDGIIYETFNIVNEFEVLKEKYPALNEINVLNMGGLSVGEPSEEWKLSEERREVFKEVLESNKTTELYSTWNDESAIYRYVPYTSEYDTGVSKHKVLEIVYNNEDVQTLLNKNKSTFIVQLIIITSTLFLVAFIMYRWVMRQIYLANHDTLTGLKNRTAYNEYIDYYLMKNKGTLALLIVDLDNFKQINDQYGHNKGDLLLQNIAQSIQHSIEHQGEAFRIGGDEFIVILPDTDDRATKIIADKIIDHINSTILKTEELTSLQMSASAGIAYSPTHSLYVDELYKMADIALYYAKSKGKGQYKIFSNELKYKNISS